MKKGKINADKILFVSAFIILILLSLYLYDDQLFMSGGADKNLDAIGVFTTSKNDVRRRTINNFLWRQADTSDKVYQGDNIFTGSDGQAKVTLNDGTVIDIKSNSLVVLKVAAKEMELEFKSGGFLAGLVNSSSLKVKDGSNEFRIDGTAKVDISKVDSGASRFKVLEGEVSVQKGADNVRLKQGETVALEKQDKNQPQEKLKKREASSIDIKPLPSEGKFSFVEGDSLKLTWKPKGPISSYRVELSKEKTFEGITNEFSTTLQKVETKEFPTSGTYYWRVVGFDERKEEVCASKSSIVSFHWLKRPEITSPQADQVFDIGRDRFGAPATSSSVEIQWKTNVDPTSHQLQVAKTPDFVKPLSDVKTKDLSYKTAELPEGKYFVRARSTFANKRNSMWSATVPFEVKFAALKIFLPPPTLGEFKEKFLIHLDAQGNLVGPFPTLKWSTVAQTKEYRLEVSKEPTFKSINHSYQTPKTEWKWNDATPGVWHYRVVAFARTQEQGEMSATKAIEIITDSPTVAKPPDLTLRAKSSAEGVGPQQIQLNWQKNQKADQYVVQMSKTPDFEKPQTIQSREPASTVVLPEPGDYFFRVQSLDQNSQTISPFSQPVKMNFTEIPVLDPPVANEPRSNMTFYYQVNAPLYVWLGWNKVRNASVYKIEVSNDPTFQLVILTESVKKEKYLIKRKLPNGKFYWRIKAMTKDQKTFSDWSQPRDFLVVSD